MITIQQAKALGRYYSIYRNNLEELARLLGIEIWYITEGHFDGVSVILPNKRKIILVDILSKNPGRIRFTIAHEIGHIITRSRPENKEKVFFSIGRNTYQEKIANAFAVELLMPKAAVYECYKKGMSLTELCKFFEVSKEAMLYRLNELGLKVKPELTKDTFIAKVANWGK
ncbi:MAG: ImmA/IrrE family metallo-endopeptidase [Dictyoglomus turgidum]